MHPEYLEKAPRGSDWYILLEDGTMLEGGPYPSEEATWAEIARLEPRDEPEQQRAKLGAKRPASARRAPIDEG